MNSNSPAVAGPGRINWPILLVGMTIAGFVALSVHVVMIQGLGVPYPADGDAPDWARFINTAGSICALMGVCALAWPRLASWPLVVRCLVVFAIYVMIKETLRGLVMDGVVTTGWVFAAVKALPGMAYDLVSCCLIVLLTPRLKGAWLKLAGGIALSALLFFVVKPVVTGAFNPLLASLAYLAHDDLYQLPYGWNVLIPAYLTFAEPTLACLAIAALAWDRLSPSPGLRLAQFIALIMLIKGSVFRILLYSAYIKAPLPTAVLSESQFTLEMLALALLTGLVWRASLRPAATDPAARR